MKRVIQIKYSCKQCGIIKRTVSVIARTTESVTDWMENNCIIAIAKDHSIQSPLCNATEISEVIIPIENSETHKIGAGKDVPC